MSLEKKVLFLRIRTGAYVEAKISLSTKKIVKDMSITIHTVYRNKNRNTFFCPLSLRPVLVEATFALFFPISRVLC